MEPLVGSLIGAVAGVQGAPGLLTWLGGAVMLAATCVVVWATDKKEVRLTDSVV